MDYKKMIIELIHKINNQKLLRFVYYMLDDAVNRSIELFGESASK